MTTLQIKLSKFALVITALLLCVALACADSYAQSFPRMGGTPPNNVYGLTGAKNVYADEHYFPRPTRRAITGVADIPEELRAHSGYNNFNGARLFGVVRGGDSIYGVRNHPFNGSNSQNYFR